MKGYVLIAFIYYFLFADLGCAFSVRQRAELSPTRITGRSRKPRCSPALFSSSDLRGLEAEGTFDSNSGPVSTTKTRRQWIESAVTNALAAAAAASRPIHAGATELAHASEVYSQASPIHVVPSALCDQTVSSFRRGSRVVHIVGTAHISSLSANLAGRVVREVLPDAVYIELDLRRIGRAFRQGQPIAGIQIAYQDEKGGLKMGTVASRPSGPGDIITRIANKAFDLMGSPFKSMYERLEEEGFLAGEEFVVAVEEGLNTGAVIVLGDQRMDVTLRRISNALARTDLKKLKELDRKLEQMLRNNIPELKEWQSSPETFGADELRVMVETMKTKETTKSLMNVFKSEVPEVYDALVGERDTYMATGLNSLKQFKTIVAVMGLGHLDGVERNLKALGWSKITKTCS